MSYRLVLKASASKALAKLPTQIRQRIADHINSLADGPRPPGCRKLMGRVNEYRIRVGDYRVVYTINDDQREVEIGIIADRKDVYRGGH